MPERVRGLLSRTSARGTIALLAILALALVVIACGGSSDSDTTLAVDEGTESESTEESVEDTAAPVEEAVTTTTEAAQPADLNLYDDDSHGQFVLRVGERVRVELKPWANSMVEAVRWELTPAGTIVVEEVDTGETVIKDVVVEGWVEYEAITPGRVTLRAFYDYPYGETRSKWVAYLIIRE